MKNPFPVSSYEGPELFCDRQLELSQIQETIESGRHLTLHSIRRLGKTGLIQHYFQSISKTKLLPIYLDVYKTQTIEDFTNTLITAISNAYDERFSTEKWLNRLTDLLKGMSARLSFDPYTGMPKVSLEFRNKDEVLSTIDTAFALLAKKKVTSVIAIDEFQQIQAYEEKGIPALLREQMQRYSNLKFIFLGSQRHMLLSMFNASEPLFRTTSFMELSKIQHQEYSTFILKQFKKAEKQLDQELIDDILNWTERHTYYVQEFCNRLFAKSITDYTAEDIRGLKLSILRSNEPIFYNYRNLLTTNQWNLLKAIAAEAQVQKPTNMEFLTKHKLGAPSTVRSALEALINNDLVYVEETLDHKTYHVYDVWHRHWLANL